LSGVLEIAAREPTNLFHGDVTASIIDRFSKATRNSASGFAVPVVAVAVPFHSSVQLPFPKKGASVTGVSSPTLHRRVPHPG